MDERRGGFHPIVYLSVGGGHEAAAGNRDGEGAVWDSGATAREV